MARSKTKKRTKKQKAPAPLAERAGRWPVVGAWVNADWQRFSRATVVIVRESRGGELAEGEVLVDLGCLGVKSSRVRSIDREDVHLLEDDAELEAVDPSTAAAIVVQGQAWGERWGFPGGRAWRDFEPFLAGIEPDTEVEVPLGRDGKPLFTPGEGDDARRIISTLRRSAGLGNFDWVLGPGLSKQDAMELLMEEPAFAGRMDELIARMRASLEAGEQPDAEALMEGIRALAEGSLQAHRSKKG